MKVLLSYLLFFSFIQVFLDGCTAFQIQSKKGEWLYARAMDFNRELDSNILIVPRDIQYIGTALDKEGMSWKTQYGIVGMNQSVHKNFISDGMNEKGLVVGALLLPGSKYERFDPEKIGCTIAPTELPLLLLGCCADLEEVRKMLSSVLVVQSPIKEWEGATLPIHFYVGDANGKVIVVEYIKGERKIYDAPLGGLTNAPFFERQLKNIEKYVHMDREKAQSKVLKSLANYYSSTSRFIRANLFSAWVDKRENELEAANLCFHLLNSFDIPDGILSKNVPERMGKGWDSFEKTHWAIVHDRTNMRSYVRNYRGLYIQAVDFSKIDFTLPSLHQIKLKNRFFFEEVSHEIVPLEDRLSG